MHLLKGSCGVPLAVYGGKRIPQSAKYPYPSTVKGWGWGKC